MKQIPYYILFAILFSCVHNRNKSVDIVQNISEVYETDDDGNIHGLYLKMKGDIIIEKYRYNHGKLHGNAELRIGDTLLKQLYENDKLMKESTFFKNAWILEKNYFENGRIQSITTFFPESQNDYGYNANSFISYRENGGINLAESNFIYHYKKADTITIRTPHENSISASIELVEKIKDRYNYELVKKFDVELVSDDQYRFVFKDISEKGSTIFFRVEIKRKSGENIYLNDVNFFKVENSELLDSVNVMPLW